MKRIAKEHFEQGRKIPRVDDVSVVVDNLPQKRPERRIFMTKIAGKSGKESIALLARGLSTNKAVGGRKAVHAVKSMCYFVRN